MSNEKNQLYIGTVCIYGSLKGTITFSLGTKKIYQFE